MNRNIRAVEESALEKASGCKTPCNFLEYKAMGDPLNDPTTVQQLSMWMVTTNVELKTEEFTYPFRSLVADVGGTLGLFLGVSFLSLLDVVQSGITFYRFIRNDLVSGSIDSKNEQDLGSGD